jgi:hypothetical protein
MGEKFGDVKARPAGAPGPNRAGKTGSIGGSARIATADSPGSSAAAPGAPGTAGTRDLLSAEKSAVLDAEAAPPDPAAEARARRERDIRRALQFPSYRAGLDSALEAAIAEITPRSRLIGADTPGLPAPLRVPVEKRLTSARTALATGDDESAVQAIIALSEELDAKAASARLPASQRGTLGSVAEKIFRKVDAPRIVSVPPPEAVERAERLFSSYLEQSGKGLNAIDVDGYANFIDTFGGTERIRPDDAADALLRLNAGIWSVMRDVRSGAIGPEAFGKTSWDQVDGRVLYDLSRKRLDADELDYAQVIPAMQRDPLWKARPMTFSQGGQRVELTPENYSKFWKRSIYSTFAPNEAAESVEAMKFAQTMKNGAIAAADGARSEAAANLDTAYAFFKGQGIAANPAMASATIAEATGVDIVSRFDPAQAGASRADLEKLREKGQIDGFVQVPGSDKFLTYKLKTIPEIAREIQDKLDRGDLANLPADTRARLSEMIGPKGRPGALLADMVEVQQSGRFWREFASEAVTIAAVGLASGGVGLIAEGAAFAAGAGRVAIGAARLVATSATFTTLMGAAQGELDWKRYPIDMAMFGVLQAAGRFAGLAEKLVGNQVARQVIGHSAAIGSASAVMTGFGALEQAAHGKLPGFEDLSRQFGRNLAMVTVLHGVNLGIARAGILPEGPVQAEHQKLAARILEADAAVERTLSDLAKVTEAAGKAPEGERAALAQRAADLMKEFDAQARQIDALRGDLLTFADKYLARDQAAKVRDAVGTPNPDMASVGAPTAQQTEAMQTFLTKFNDFATFGVERGIVENGVKGLSQRSLLALAEAFRSPYGSVDMKGAANVDHLASVYRGVLAEAAASKGRPLTQPEVDRLATETVLTDAWMKGVSPDVLKSVQTAPTNAGRTGGAIHDHLKQQAKSAIDAGGPISPEVRKLIHTWIDRAFIPMSPDAVKAEATKAALSPEQVTELNQVWGKRIMADGNWATAQGFMLGTWLHGMPAFETVRSVVASAGGKAGATPQQIYEAVLGHHMAGFVANGFSKGGLQLDFKAMESAGQLPPGGATRLGRLYDSASTLAGKWRPVIDGATRKGQALTAEQRAEYARDAAPLRKAIEALPENVRSQLLNDDAQQFTEVGMPKWLAMFKGMRPPSITNGELVKTVYSEPAQAYYEENLARGSGTAFERSTTPIAERLGVTLDGATGQYRPARTGEAAHSALAKSITADPALGKQLAAELGDPAKLSPTQIVDWFNGKPADVAVLGRLAATGPR